MQAHSQHNHQQLNQPQQPQPQLPPPADCIDLLVQSLALPIRIANLARAIHNSAEPSSPDLYTSACALYIASVAYRADQIPQLPLTQLLDAANAQVRHIPEFILNARFPEDLFNRNMRPPSPPPSARDVPPSHTAFMVTAHVWRKLRFLIGRRLLHNHPSVPRLAWLLFIIAKASLSSPSGSWYNHVQAYHLLLACLMQSGLIAADDPENAVFRITCAVPSELHQYQRAVDTLLPPAILTRLPFFPATDDDIDAHGKALDEVYAQQLTAVDDRIVSDERIFLHAPQLTAVTALPLSPPLPRQSSCAGTSTSSQSPRPVQSSVAAPLKPNKDPPVQVGSPVQPTTNAEPSTPQASSQPSTPLNRKRRMDGESQSPAPTPRPRRRRKASDFAVTPSSARPPTPRRTRTRSAMHSPLSSPVRFSRYLSTHPDALEALATVAAVTPHCTTVVPPTPPSSNVALTPGSDNNRSATWISELKQKRPETRSETCLTCPLDSVATSDDLRRVTGGGRPLYAIIDVGRRYSDALCDVIPDLNTSRYKREALAVYFSAMEGILEKERRRLREQPEKFNSNVLHNYILHKSFLTFAWETTVAAYGRRDLQVFTVAYRAFNVSPFELTKALDTFCTLVPQMPRCLVNHLISCDARILEWMAWKHDSPLVRVLQAYSRDCLLTQDGPKPFSPKEKFEEASVGGDTQMFDQSVAHNEQPDSVEQSPVTPQKQKVEEGQFIETKAMSTPRLKEMERPERLYGDVEARARVLDFFFEKVFALAGTRTEELLRRLDLTNLRSTVWRSVKYALWCRWNLTINRHVDLIILCVIYGVAKIRHIQLQFRHIVWHYNQLEHTSDPTFLSNSPPVSRNILLEDFGHLLAGDAAEDGGPRSASTTEETGDIIRFYNEVFVPYMSNFIVPTGEDTGGRDAKRLAETSQESKADDQGSEGLNDLARRASRREGRERKEMFEDLGRKLLQSPMRIMKTRRSPIRIGSIVVSPMSPSTRNMVLSRQHSVRRSQSNGLGSMTPGTRSLFAFGESPIGNVAVIHRRRERRRYRPLSFDGPVADARSAAVRREVQEIIGRSGRVVSSAESDSGESEDGTVSQGADGEDMEV